MVLLYQELKSKNCCKIQNSYSLHHPAYHTFARRRVYIHSVDDQWQTDLVEMQQYKSESYNFNCILAVIDCFSKYAWCISLKNKMGKNIINAFTVLF
jgi:transposase InsO family protein